MGLVLSGPPPHPAEGPARRGTQGEAGVRASGAWRRGVLAGGLALGLALLGVGPARAAAPPAGGVAAASAAAVGGAGTINLFYGQAMTPEAWYARDRAALSAALPALTLRSAYNQWLAIADLRAAYYRATGRLEPGGVTVYPQDPSAVVHVLDLALWAREHALLWLLGLRPPQPYPAFGTLGYRDAGRYLGSVRHGNPLTPGQIGALISALPLPPALFAGDRIFLMPYRLAQEYALTDVYGPGIRTWLGSDASIDPRHVLYHELGHAVHFRFGGFDTTTSGQPLSPFWREYMRIRGLTWQDPSQVPWKDQTIECFAEDFAYAFDGPHDLLGYQTACPVPTAPQLARLLAFWRGLPQASYVSPYQQAQWVRWRAPWPSFCFGGFSARLFTAAGSVGLRLSLAPQATGGPYTVQVVGGATPLATLAPGTAWSGRVPVPAGGRVQVAADAPALQLTWLRIYNNAAFTPVPRISGVFPDTLGTWAEAGIAAAVRAGIVGGYPDGLFRPAGSVTRAQFARMVASALPARLFESAPTPTWSDVGARYWAAPYIAAVGAALPGTTPGGPFHPGRTLDRQQAVSWLVQAFGFSPLTRRQAAAMLATYPDGSLVGRVDAPWFATALSLGLVQGQAGSGGLAPDAPVTRAEAAVLVLEARHLSAVQAGLP